VPLSRPDWHPHLWHPFTQVATADPPLRVVRGAGALLELDDGRRLIDAISSWWVTLHGHGEPAIADAIARQARTLEQVGFSDFRHPAAEQLAERLAACSGLERLFFSDNGSTAVEVALKIAWQWWRNRGEPRQQLIAFDGAYHGDTFGAMAVGERSLFSAPFEPLLFAVARAPWPATWWDDDGVEARETAALERLQDPELCLKNKDPICKALASMVQSDSSAEVRKAALSAVVISKHTLQHIVARTHDVKEDVRACAFAQLGSRVHIKSLSISQRNDLLKAGLKDRSRAVRQECQKMLCSHWVTLVQGDMLALLP